MRTLLISCLLLLASSAHADEIMSITTIVSNQNAGNGAYVVATCTIKTSDARVATGHGFGYVHAFDVHKLPDVSREAVAEARKDAQANLTAITKSVITGRGVFLPSKAAEK